MKVKVLAFGIAKEILGGQALSVEMPEGALVADLRLALDKMFPKIKDLSSVMIAVNNEYAQPTDALSAADEIAIIPPVSGG
jgi:molybdopterin synthase sulfur carrier subunit